VLPAGVVAATLGNSGTVQARRMERGRVKGGDLAGLLLLAGDLLPDIARGTHAG